jgi:hypothetical protein
MKAAADEGLRYLEINRDIPGMTSNSTGKISFFIIGVYEMWPIPGKV